MIVRFIPFPRLFVPYEMQSILSNQYRDDLQRTLMTLVPSPYILKLILLLNPSFEKF